ncbi:MAG TPA: TMEM175 family protein [Caulobacteraceae bacterium]
MAKLSPIHWWCKLSAAKRGATMGQLESLDSDEGLARRRHRHWYDRLMMLTDGVFAIALTLLAAGIAPPLTHGMDLAQAWASVAPQLDVYSLSAVVIAVFWLAHRRFMAMILTVDAPITVITLVLLSLVALIPAATRLARSTAAMTIYGGLVVAIGLTCAAMWGYAALVADLVSKEVPRSQRWYLFALMLVTPPLFLVLTAALPHPSSGAVSLALVALFIVGWRMRTWAVRRLWPDKVNVDPT